MKYLVFFLFVGALFSCSDYDSTISDKKEVKDTIALDLLQALKKLDHNHDSINFDTLIHDQLGLHLITKKENKIQLTLIDNYSELKQSKSIFQFKMMEVEELPKPICESSVIYTKKGLYCEADNTKLLKEKNILLNNVHESHRVALENIINSVEVSAVKTFDNAINYYFSKIDGKWYLTFLDTRNPCKT